MALTNFEHDILTALMRLLMETSGGALRHELSCFLGRPVSARALYAALGRLAERRYVSVRWGEAPEAPGRRPTRMISLRAAGLRAIGRRIN
jgi:DNA-binding PadR family transcriptional regulator